VRDRDGKGGVGRRVSKLNNRGEGEWCSKDEEKMEKAGKISERGRRRAGGEGRRGKEGRWGDERVEGAEGQGEDRRLGSNERGGMPVEKRPPSPCGNL